MPPVNGPREPQVLRVTVQRTIVARASFDEPAQCEDEQGSVAELGPDDLVIQKHPRAPRNVDVEHAHAVPDSDWELERARARTSEAR